MSRQGKRHREWSADSLRSKTDKTARAKYDGTQNQDMAVVERVAKLADKYSVTMSQIAVAWLWKKGVASPIIGATKPKYFDDLALDEKIALTNEDIAYLEEEYQPHKIVGAL